MRIAFSIPAFLLLTATLRAGTIVTTDGDTITGDLKRTEDGWSVTLDDGQVKSVTNRRVKSIELGGGAARPGRAAEGLRSLRRSVDFSDDLDKIVQRYRTFIEQSKDAAVTSQAKEDLAVWQTRLDQRLVKVGKRWLTPPERDGLRMQWRRNAEQARLLIKDARDREAEALIADTLDQDPQNASALYLRGVLADQRQDVPEAKKAYLAVQQALPQHAPTLLNLALVLIKQKQWPAACVAMDQALQAAPVTQVLLDTAAEFINASPPDTHRGSAAQKLLRTFLDQDARLQKQMAGRQLYRWGATWINQTDHDRLKAKSDEVQARIAAIQKDFDAAQQRLTRIDGQIADNQRSMRDMEVHSYTKMPDGTIIRVPLPRRYYDLQSETAALKIERTEIEAKIEPLRADARDAQKTLPLPTYTGALIPIDEDGVPLADLPGDAPAATQSADPSTRPSSVIRIGPPDEGLK